MINRITRIVLVILLVALVSQVAWISINNAKASSPYINIGKFWDTDNVTITYVGDENKTEGFTKEDFVASDDWEVTNVMYSFKYDDTIHSYYYALVSIFKAGNEEYSNTYANVNCEFRYAETY